jgi:hypothetical protein
LKVAGMPKVPTVAVILLTATVVVFAILGFLALTHMASFGGGQVFDVRFFGYGHAEAVRFLEAVGPVGRKEYLEVWQRLDTAFPVLYFLSLTWVSATIYVAAGVPIRGARLAAVATVAPATVFDFAENAAVAVMLRLTPPEVTPDMVEAASGYTTVKWALAAAGFAAAGLGLARAVARARAR